MRDFRIIDDDLSEIPRFHFDAVDVQIRNVDVSRLRRQGARIDARTAVMELITAPVRERKTSIALANGSKLRGQICQLVGDQVDDLALSLDAALHRDHSSRENDPTLSFIERWPDHQVGDAGLVLNGEPARCRPGCCGRRSPALRSPGWPRARTVPRRTTLRAGTRSAT